MKVYFGMRYGVHETFVGVLDDSTKKVKKLIHYPYHSPSGFNWGYPGSGPADLALAILVDVLGERPPRMGWEAKTWNGWSEKSMAYRFHQDLKNLFVAGCNGNSWHVTEEVVRKYVPLLPNPNRIQRESGEIYE